MWLGISQKIKKKAFLQEQDKSRKFSTCTFSIEVGEQEDKGEVKRRLSILCDLYSVAYGDRFRSLEFDLQLFMSAVPIMPCG